MQNILLEDHFRINKKPFAKTPKVSIITVCFNSAKTIERTILSVQNQTYKNIEYIIVDGKSNDSTLQIINKFNFIDKFISEEDVGIYDAMNKGILLASGEIIAFLNADDFYKRSDIVEKVVKKLIADKLDIIYGDVDFFRPCNINKITRRYSSKIFSPKKLSYGLMPAHPSLFVRKKIYMKIGNFDATFKIAGDFDFIARAFKIEKLRYLYIPEVFVSMQTGGISTSGIKATVNLNREIMQSCLKNNIKTNWLKLISRYFIKIFEFTGFLY